MSDYTYTEQAGLLSCPFCGGQAAYHFIPGGMVDDRNGEDRDWVDAVHQVVCAKNSCAYFNRNDKPSAVSKWNTRSLPASFKPAADDAWLGEQGWQSMASELWPLAQVQTHIGEGIQDAEDRIADFLRRQLLSKPAGVDEEQGWQDIATAPRDGTPVVTGQLVRYLPYKPDGKRQMKADGRWQAWDGYGWSNIDWEPTEWKSAKDKANDQ